MKKTIFLLTFLLTMLVSPMSFAEGNANGKIVGYAMNTGGVYVSSDSAITSKPACNTTDRFYFKLDTPHSEYFLSSILAAYTTGEKISLTGTGDCDGGNSEILRKICTQNVPC